jgi:hypothetical protein
MNSYSLIFSIAYKFCFRKSEGRAMLIFVGRPLPEAPICSSVLKVLQKP